MITLYADESGQHQDETRMFVAGYMGDDDAWKKVPSLWLEAIGPQRKHLHMNELKFKRHSEKKMLERAGLVPKNCGLIPAVGGVRMKDYRHLVRGTQEEKPLCGYALCVYAMVYNALRVVPPNDRLEVVLEQQERYGVYADAVMQVIADMSDDPEVLMADGKPKLASWRFVPKSTTSLTEPGDYFAYALFQMWKDPTSTRSVWCKPILDAHDGKGIGHIWNRDEMHEVVLAGPLSRMPTAEIGILLEMARNTMPNEEFAEFNKAIDAILRADPKAVKEAVEAGIKLNTAAREARGEQRRGRKPDSTSVSDRASNAKD